MHGQTTPCPLPEENPAVLVVGGDVAVHLILANVGEEVVVRAGIQVIGMDDAAFHTERDGEWPDAREHVPDHTRRQRAPWVPCLELLGDGVDQTTVFRGEAAIPINLGIIEVEGGPTLSDGHLQIVLPSQDLEGEGPEARFDVACFIYHCANARRVLVEDNLGDEALVWKVGITEVDVCDMVDGFEGGGGFHLQGGEELLEDFLHGEAGVVHDHLVGGQRDSRGWGR